MKIGVWLGYDLKESAGGAFSYVDRLIQLIDEYEFPKDLEICFVNLFGIGSYHKKCIPIIPLPTPIVGLLKKYVILYNIAKFFSRKYIARKGLRNVLSGSEIKVMYYLHQGECLDSNFPFIATNWDIGHRSTHAFPELMWDGKPYEVRECFYRDVLPKALLVFCESQAGKQELIRYTNLGEHKIKVFPLFGGNVTNVKLSVDESEKILNSYHLKENEYFFYPAQFWPHKNHVGLIKAFAKVLETYPNFKLVLSGADKGNREYVKSIISELGITDKVLFLGFVSVEKLYCLYKYATALVMASHFGPTNMPPIEAMEIGCPVVCSNLDGHHEILGDAASYFNSYSVISIVDALEEIVVHNVEYRRKIADRKTSSEYVHTKAMPTFVSLLYELKNIRENWG